MRGVLAGSLGLSLALWAGTAGADDVPGRPNNAEPTTRPAAVALGRPTAAAILDRPVPLPAGGPRNSGPVVRTSFAATVLETPRSLVRAQAADTPQPLPVGPSLGLDAPSKPERTGPGVVIARRQGNNGSGGPPVASSGAPAPSAPAAVPVTPPPTIWGYGGAAPFGMDVSSAAGCCGAEGGPCGDDCCKSSRFWISAEYLLWWIRDGGGPALVTTGNNGLLPGAMVLFSGNDVHYPDRSGARVSSGFWLDCEHTIGIDASFFFLAKRHADFSASSTGVPGSATLFRPFLDINPLTPGPNAEFVSVPGLAGTVTVASTSQFWGGDSNLRINLHNGPVCGLGLTSLLPRNWGCCGDDCGMGCAPCCGMGCAADWCCRWDLLTGFRFLELDEKLSIAERLFTLVPFGGTPAGTSFLIMDHFNTRNYFYGGQVGTELELSRGRFSLDFLGKVGLGSTHEVVNINGTTTLTLPGGMPMTLPGGLLTQAGTNIGRFTGNSFAVVPEVGVKVGWQLTPNLRLTAGYNFLYWSNVARPGMQIDSVVNSSLLPFRGGVPMGPARPAFVMRETDFWAHGVNFGLEFKY